MPQRRTFLHFCPNRLQSNGLCVCCGVFPGLVQIGVTLFRPWLIVKRIPPACPADRSAFHYNEEHAPLSPHCVRRLRRRTQWGEAARARGYGEPACSKKPNDPPGKPAGFTLRNKSRCCYPKPHKTEPGPKVALSNEWLMYLRRQKTTRPVPYVCGTSARPSLAWNRATGAFDAPSRESRPASLMVNVAVTTKESKGESIPDTTHHSPFAGVDVVGDEFSPASHRFSRAGTRKKAARSRCQGNGPPITTQNSAS